ncbi:uncharacterized protein CLUP02_17137 [Colletotrichum lupini]|uniref:Uncharacterized protein n=1 Tax=Colletotrichum lupini TaxID=145971 RepID=A0A9Q8TBH2_9PEZI|nr:uncharacterized protein CLUP02_17137 [Colletotrichum lupini]UQC91601.1 hypothetical protein CLUP02_17137 [Colletotrichum lupini]
MFKPHLLAEWNLHRISTPAVRKLGRCISKVLPVQNAQKVTLTIGSKLIRSIMILIDFFKLIRGFPIDVPNIRPHESRFPWASVPGDSEREYSSTYLPEPKTFQGIMIQTNLCRGQGKHAEPVLFCPRIANISEPKRYQKDKFEAQPDRAIVWLDPDQGGWTDENRRPLVMGVTSDEMNVYLKSHGIGGEIAIICKYHIRRHSYGLRCPIIGSTSLAIPSRFLPILSEVLLKDLWPLPSKIQSPAHQPTDKLRLGNAKVLKEQTENRCTVLSFSSLAFVQEADKALLTRRNPNGLTTAGKLLSKYFKRNWAEFEGSGLQQLAMIVTSKLAAPTGNSD